MPRPPQSAVLNCSAAPLAGTWHFMCDLHGVKLERKVVEFEGRETEVWRCPSGGQIVDIPLADSRVRGRIGQEGEL